MPAVAQHHDPGRRVRGHLGQGSTNGPRDVGSVAPELDLLRGRQAGARPQGVLDRGFGRERQGADAIVVAHAQLGQLKLAAHARVGVGHQIDAAAAIDGDQHRQPVQGLSQLGADDGQARRERRDPDQELGQRPARGALSG